MNLSEIIIELLDVMKINEFTLCDCGGDVVKVEQSHPVRRASDAKKCYLCFKCFDEIIWSVEQKDE